MAAASTKSDKEKEAAREASYANGIRAAREAKGYSRIQCAEALEITTGAYWKMEHTDDAAEIKKGLAAIKALPEFVKPKKEKSAKAAAPKAGAKKSTAKADDLI